MTPERQAELDAAVECGRGHGVLANEHFLRRKERTDSVQRAFEESRAGMVASFKAQGEKRGVRHVQVVGGTDTED